MTKVTLEEAGTQLPLLIQAVSQGEEIVITQDDQPVAKLVSIPRTRPNRQPGSAKGLILHIAEDFDAPLEDFKEYMPRDC
jgi:prevent-host-death family protein